MGCSNKFVCLILKKTLILTVFLHIMRRPQNDHTYGSVVVEDSACHNAVPLQNDIVRPNRWTLALVLIALLTASVIIAAHPRAKSAVHSLLTNPIGWDPLWTHDNISADFIVAPLCSNPSPLAQMYCLYPSSNSWTEFVDLRFFKYSWTGPESELQILEMDHFNLANSSVIRIGAIVDVASASISPDDGREVYVFAVNRIDSTVNTYSFTTFWRLHHYAPSIAGDSSEAEIDGAVIRVRDEAEMLYFSVNPADPLANFTVYHYVDNIFSVFLTVSKRDVRVYAHCLTESDGSALVFYVDYDQNLRAIHQGVDDINMNVDIEDIAPNQLQCVWTEEGNVVSWMASNDTLGGDMVQYLLVSPGDITQIVSRGRKPLDEWSR